MAVVRFTADNAALLLIDHQVGTMQLIKNIDSDLAAKQSIALAKMAKILNMPVVITSSQEDQAQGPILPEIAQVLPDAYAARVKRPGVVNAWEYPDFHNAVLATGRKNLIMAGVTTDVCLIFPAIDAAQEGFAVQAVMDASGSPSLLSEEFARQRMHDAGVVLTATNTLMAEIGKDWSTPIGQQLIGLLFSDVFPA
ncbi:isochorismatase family protein, partial [Pseudomonas alloputida]